MIAPSTSPAEPARRGLFLNPSKAACSIYESGRMMYESLLNSENFRIDYLEIDADHRRVPGNYDFYAFNYHHLTMAWLDTSALSCLPGLKATFVLEVLPNDPFACCPATDFDVYCVLDPSLKSSNPRVYAFPRPLESSSKRFPFNLDATAIPTIGSFGFATVGKGFELVVEAVNREFDEALVRINIPHGAYADDASWKLQRQPYAEYLANLCRRVAKRGVQVEITNHYLGKDELIEWCGRNTLNCFLYNRNQPGLSATTDQAIASGRPLAVGTNPTFRHIHPYLTPYPFRSLRESISASVPQTEQMQRDWAPARFAQRFADVLMANGAATPDAGRARRDVSAEIELPLKSSPGKLRRLLSKLATRLRSLAAAPSSEAGAFMTVNTPSSTAPTILIVSHQRTQCGIHQYGMNIAEALRKSARYSIEYAECSSAEELANAVRRTRPIATLYNHYPATMPWLQPEITRHGQVPQIGILHEVTQQEADRATRDLFDFYVCPDPTLTVRQPFIFKTPRLIPTYINTQPLPEIVTIGSFGFGFGDKGFERLVSTVQQEFERAKIILRMPFNDVVDPEGKTHALATAERCRLLLTNPGVELTIHHDFLTKSQLLDFLAGNTINAFFYDVAKDRGISSTIEHALAAQRPLAINRCGMFRHVHRAEPSICIEDNSLRQIIANGIAALVPFYLDWSEANFILAYEQIFDQIVARGHNRGAVSTEIHPANARILANA